MEDMIDPKPQVGRKDRVGTSLGRTWNNTVYLPRRRSLMGDTGLTAMADSGPVAAGRVSTPGAWADGPALGRDRALAWP